MTRTAKPGVPTDEDARCWKRWLRPSPPPRSQGRTRSSRCRRWWRSSTRTGSVSHWGSCIADLALPWIPSTCKSAANALRMSRTVRTLKATWQCWTWPCSTWLLGGRGAARVRLSVACRRKHHAQRETLCFDSRTPITWPERWTAASCPGRWTGPNVPSRFERSLPAGHPLW